MTWLWVLAVVLVLFGSVLAMAESSLTRMTRVRAMALRRKVGATRRSWSG